jgi:truncated hemoglobin YjbI
MTPGNSHVLEKLGGEDGCMRLAQSFYARVAGSTELKPLFPGKSVRCATEEFSAFLIQFLEGEEGQTQCRWWLSLRESHARFEISQRQRAEWLRLMHETLASELEDAELRADLDRFFQTVSTYLVGKGEAKVAPGELGDRWASQRDLDQLVEDLLAEHDLDAISRGNQFTARPSVFVGVLARMMKAGRPALIAYVLERCEGYGSSQFNGRTLLHFAATHGCPEVARKLLQQGVEPDVLDRGGFAPLYRAAASGSVEVIEALLNAGAQVDRGAGQSGGTALHAAARFGQVAAARALLDAGASITIRDKKGDTALDRATNCRRRAVEDLIRSWPSRP